MIPVLIVQQNVTFGKPETNLEHLKEILDQEFSNRDTSSPVLVVVPELFPTGYHNESIYQLGNGIMSSEFYHDLIRLTKQYNLVLYGSVPEKDGKAYYNTGILINKEGTITKYRKSHLFRPMGEADIFEYGKEIVVAKVKEFETIFGLSICYDLRFSELYNEQAKQNAEIMLVTAEWPIVRIDHWQALLKARAIENQCFVIGVNRVGKDIDHFGGHSTVFSPYGEVVASLNHDQEGTVWANIDLTEIKQFRSAFDVREDKWI